jgi:tetratricopeptide (TPR) repeat protein
MAGLSSLARDTTALLDPDAGAEADGDRPAPRPGRVTADDIAACLRAGRQLIGVADRTGRYGVARAAVEVFRIAVGEAEDDPSVRNGLGAALVECARLEAGTAALTSLTEAAAAFRTASSLAVRQGAPRGTPKAAVMRYEMNLAMVLWMQGERESDAARVETAVSKLRDIAAAFAGAPAHWSHLHDNLGNALMALGQTETAIAAYRAALDGHQSATERGRSLNNLGTALAELGRHAEAGRAYREALALQPRDAVPLAWARTQHNLATTLLREAIAGAQPAILGKRITQAIKTFERAREMRHRLGSRMDWAVSTANLASATVSLGVHLHGTETGRDDPRAADHIRHAIALYAEAAPALDTADLRQTIGNVAAALDILRRVAGGAAIGDDTCDHLTALASLAAQHDLPDLAAALRKELIGSPVARTPKTAAQRRMVPPAGLDWPTETYAQAHRIRGEDIVAFLSRVWLPFIEAGAVDMRVLRARDPSAAKGVDNFTQKIDPATGERRRLPAHLHLPTIREVNDRLAASIAAPGDRPARLDWALRSRARRASRN